MGSIDQSSGVMNARIGPANLLRSARCFCMREIGLLDPCSVNLGINRSASRPGWVPLSVCILIDQFNLLNNWLTVLLLDSI